MRKNQAVVKERGEVVKESESQNQIKTTWHLIDCFMHEDVKYSKQKKTLSTHSSNGIQKKKILKIEKNKNKKGDKTRKPTK